MPARIFYLFVALLLGAVFASAAAASRLPMYQTYHPGIYDYFYTVDASQRDLAVSYGYVDYGVAFYVDDGSTPGAAPLYRFYKGPPQTDHFYTSDAGEWSAVQSYGWVYERVEGYVFGYQAAGTTPIYRLNYNFGGDMMHFYTSNYSQAVQLTWQGWGLDATIFYAYTTPDPPPPTPVMVHATHLTASCADKYCARLTGYNFAANSYIEMRSGSANGPIIWTETNVTRGTSGDAQTIDVVLTNPGVRGTLDHPDGVWFYVVNPGNPPGRGGGFNVIRDTGYSLKGGIDSTNSISAYGWICTDRDYNASLPYKLRDGSDAGEIVASGVAGNGYSAEVAAACGGNGAHYFSVDWPSKWRDGVARHAYLVADVGIGRYPNALVPNSPTAVTLPYIPWDAIVSYIPSITVARGAPFSSTFTFTNKGSAVWDTNVSVAQPDPAVSWMVGSLGLGGDIQPDGTRTYTVGGFAPSTAGNYTVRYRVRHSGVFFGLTAFINLNVQ